MRSFYSLVGVDVGVGVGIDVGVDFVVIVGGGGVLSDAFFMNVVGDVVDVICSVVIVDNFDHGVGPVVVVFVVVVAAAAAAVVLRRPRCRRL